MMWLRWDKVSFVVETAVRAKSAGPLSPQDIERQLILLSDRDGVWFGDTPTEAPVPPRPRKRKGGKR